MTDGSADPAQVLARARAALDAERASDARDLLAPLVEAHPRAAEAWLQLARAQAQLGQPDAARAAFAQCLTLAPKEPVVWMEAALFEATQGRGGRITAQARKAGLPQALVAMVQAAGGGQGARAMGTSSATKADIAALSKSTADPRAVEARAIPLLKARPGAVVWYHLGQARQAAGRLPQALEAFRQGLKLEPYAVDLRLALARALLSSGDLAGALMEARRAAQVAPLSVSAQLIYGRIALQAGLAPRAVSIAEALLARHPKDDAVLALAAEAAVQFDRPDDAVRFARQRSAKARDRLSLLARVLRNAGDTAGAAEVLDRILDATPDDAVALTARGQQRQSLGDTAGAEADLRAALIADPADGVAARALAYGTRLAADDPAITLMRRTLDRRDLPATGRRMLDYALARALAPHDAPAAAAHLAQANASMLRSYPYDPRQLGAVLERATQVTWPALRQARQGGAASQVDVAPIFVTGLPRSGTTLVETILAAHPDVTAGGELGVLQGSVADLTAQIAAGTAPTGADLTAAGEAYAAAARRAVGAEVGRITDKSIFTFFDIGLVQAILPKARIVVVTRDPRDVGLSIWRNAFRDGTHRYAATQTGIAEQIGLFRDAVAFWESALPGVVHRIAYEDLLDDLEGQSRALLSFAGLEWDDRVLSFHEHAGDVKTLSFAQVRQPLYRSSKDGWRKSADEIAPLIAALDEKGLLPE
ncbi:tetratricopeptide repeat-containing sulfotransferase family protein [Jannaschia donghaensis]|uniref:Putative PEP-CTERM system TPR-repeat lipoprotein n=1 Tax=Jannaschia donghaensis TaxID=420998 RepID=A0A0M6YE70_9RHOB|nr:tetratricopeptide repeat-containing sulfotransferase family protein [Jannaschia donghaensis]CTQ48642.1 putative PEP-CTERM system TPR-repeat lipoprotein [Jannaschia donghaensis]